MRKLNESEVERLSVHALREQGRKTASLDAKMVPILQRIKP